MRKFVKILCLVLMVVMLMSTVSGCVKMFLSGAWENDKTSEIFVFHPDGTMDAYLEDGTVTHGTYSYKTDIRYLYCEVENNTFKEGKGYDPRKLLLPGTEALTATVIEKIELFGSAGKA